MREIEEGLFLARCAWLSEKRVAPSAVVKAKHELISRAEAEKAGAREREERDKGRERERVRSFGSWRNESGSLTGG